jgi:hypothetical protein
MNASGAAYPPGDDSTVRIWDPATSRLLLTAPVHHQVQAVDYASGSLV